MKPPSFLSLFAALAGALLCAGCGAGDDEPVRVNAIGSARDFAAPLTHIDTRAGQIMLAATARGLVSVDPDGTVVPALAQRWIELKTPPHTQTFHREGFSILIFASK